MGSVRCVLCAVLLLCPLALSRHDEDFAFENSDEFQVELTANHSEIAKNGLKRLWGVPDTTAYVGHLFRMEISKEAFSGEVIAYKVRSSDGRPTPNWVAVDTKHGLVTGVPQHQDLGAHTFTVTAHGRTHGLTAKDSFTVEVKKASEKPQSKYGSCAAGEERLVLTVLIDAPYHTIPARQRIRAIMELAKFMALDGDEFWIEPHVADRRRPVISGGAMHAASSHALTAINLNVGCGSTVWPRHRGVAARVREPLRDGTLAAALRLPLAGWTLAAQRSRRKRQSPLDEGSGSYDNYDGDDDPGDYSGGYEDDDDDEDYPPVDVGHVPDLVDTPHPPAPLHTTPPPSHHPHRHHHGEPISTTDTFQTDAAATTEDLKKLTPIPTLTSPPSPVSPPTEDPTTARSELPTEPATNTITEDHKVKITPYSEPPVTNNMDITNPVEIVPRRLPDLHMPIDITPINETIPTSTEPELTDHSVVISETNELPWPDADIEAATAESAPPPTLPSTPLTTPSTTTSTSTTTTSTTTSTSTSTSTTTAPPPPPVIMVTNVTAPETTTELDSTTQERTTQDIISTTEHTSPIMGVTTETVVLAMPFNQSPTLKHHMKKLAITAGNAFRYIIPADLFTDPEDGSNLTFTMYEAENVPLSNDFWIQFIPSDREVYGLPLESHVSRWNFIVEAEDSQGLSARGPLDITVQQHKSGRNINHHFVMQFRLVHNYTKPVDWQIRALEGIVNLFRDTDMDHLIVLNATQNGDICEFVWTNDTLPKDVCPTDDINRLMKIMESESEPGTPSAGVARAMSPELKVSGVSWRGRGACAQGAGPAGAGAGAGPRVDTYPPVTRNQVDMLSAPVGHLLVYKVPEDTFFDPEDGGTRNLRLSLRHSDRSPLAPAHWLQFDDNNQEFYGLPGAEDEGTSVHYQLIAEDSSKKSAYDSLIVEVVKAPAIRPTVEFHMTLEYPFARLALSAATKRAVLQRLAALFGQTTTDNIRIHSISENPTTIIWYNTSLPMDRCPKKEIEELRKMIISDEHGSKGGALKENVDQIFDKDFKVMSIRLIPLGLCAEQNTKTKSVVPVAAGGIAGIGLGGVAEPEGGYTEYLVTIVIPAIVVVCMILVAGVIACVLYRRRRTGKMSVGDEEERQAFRSKGIPVIFQDELEERGESAHKSPVIMREEKPPLLPAPDYREPAPYRPPPPFPASRTPPRTKHTPTYRKPPPYVPP